MRKLLPTLVSLLVVYAWPLNAQADEKILECYEASENKRNVINVWTIKADKDASRISFNRTAAPEALLRASNEARAAAARLHLRRLEAALRDSKTKQEARLAIGGEPDSKTKLEALLRAATEARRRAEIEARRRAEFEAEFEALRVLRRRQHAERLVGARIVGLRPIDRDLDSKTKQETGGQRPAERAIPTTLMQANEAWHQVAVYTREHYDPLPPALASSPVVVYFVNFSRPSMTIHKIGLASSRPTELKNCQRLD